MSSNFNSFDNLKAFTQDQSIRWEAFLEGMLHPDQESGFFTAGFDPKFVLDKDRPWSPYVHCNPQNQILVTDAVAFAKAIELNFDSWFLEQP